MNHHLRFQSLVLALLLVGASGCRDAMSHGSAGTWTGTTSVAGTTTTVHTQAGSLLGDLGTIPAESLAIVYAGEGVSRATVLAASGDTLLIGEGAQLVVLGNAAVADTIGRAGDGPGEFRQIIGVNKQGDSIAVADAIGYRLTVFTPGRDPLTSTAVPPAGFQGPKSTRLSMCGGATLLVWGRGLVAPGGPPDTVAVQYWSPGTPAAPLALVPDISWSAGGPFPGPRYPFGPRALVASDGECLVATADGVGYAIELRNATTDSVTTIAVDEPRVAVTAEDRTIPEEWRAAWPPKLLTPVLALIEHQDYGDWRNQVEEVQFDAAGRLWVRVVDSTYRYHPWVMARVAGARPLAYRWDVFARDGRRSAMVRLPSAFSPRAWTSRWIYGLAEGEDGALVVGRLPVPRELR